MNLKVNDIENYKEKLRKNDDEISYLKKTIYENE